MNEKDIIGRQLKIVGDHPWAGHLAEVVALDMGGLRVRIKRNDALDGEECYIFKSQHFKVIPKGLETR